MEVIGPVACVLMSKPPSTNGSNGRDSAGRFTAGNGGGPGNPHAQRVARYRSLLLQAVSENDFRKIVKTLVDRATKGDFAAARLLLDRLLGRPCGELEPEQLEQRSRQISIVEERLELDKDRHEDSLWESLSRE